MVGMGGETSRKHVDDPRTSPRRSDGIVSGAALRSRRSERGRQIGRPRGTTMNGTEAIAELLTRKAALVKEMDERCTPARRDAIELEINEIDEKLNSIDPAKPMPGHS